MAFDSGMLACTLSEIKKNCLSSRVEKVSMPERDQVVLSMHTSLGSRRILLHAGASPRVCLTEEQRENPATPPMLCMFLRKHLAGARLVAVEQPEFERVAVLTFDGHDEMGFDCRRKLYAELMGKYSNLIVTDGEDKILTLLRTVDFSTSSLRQLLPGMHYELPPAQENRENPLVCDKEVVLRRLEESDPEMSATKALSKAFRGVSDLAAREIVFRVSGRIDPPLAECSKEALSEAFAKLYGDVKAERFSPSAVFLEGLPVGYAFLTLSHFGKEAEVRDYGSAGGMLDEVFRQKEKQQYLRERAQDLLHLLSSAQSRIQKKIALQEGELADCETGEKWKTYADLLTANLYRIKPGLSEIELDDYEKPTGNGEYETLMVPMDRRLSPAANAQRYYKKYAKTKSARVELTKQIALGREELAYLATVEEALARAESAKELGEIREELVRTGYFSLQKRPPSAKKAPLPTPAEFRTSEGYRVLCGRNNLQNEYLTHKLAGKGDYWFHAKGIPGSHVVLFAEGIEPDEKTFTEAAEVAALYSAANGAPHTEVDYTLVKNLKKPAGAKPGYVIYHQNWSCTVSPLREEVEKKRVK